MTKANFRDAVTDLLQTYYEYDKSNTYRITLLYIKEENYGDVIFETKTKTVVKRFELEPEHL